MNRRHSPFQKANPAHGGFSLLEVMIAIGIFFTSVFLILELTSQHLRTARIMQTMNVDRSSLPALLSMTNFLEIGPLPIDIKMAYEDSHPGVTVDGMIEEAATNGLFRVDYTIHWLAENNMRKTRNSILLWRPNMANNRSNLPRQR
ncbi:MAG: prepilin-type N-terminal cleavage/methylation domain-containing protein [Verrucomicrobiales bacterium]